MSRFPRQMETLPPVDISFKDQPHALNISFCLPFFHAPGSKDTSILLQMLIARELVKQGHRVQYAAPTDHGVMLVENDGQPRSVQTTWSNSIGFRAASSVSWKIQQLLKIPYLNYFNNWRFYDAYLRCFPGQDIIHERNGLYRQAAAMACRRLGLPYVYFFDGDDVLEQNYLGHSLAETLRKRAENITRYNLRSADRVICVSNTARTRLRDVWGVPENKIAVFPNGVDTELYAPNAANAAHGRGELGLTGAFVVLYVGSFYPWQDTETLLEAFAAVVKKHPRSRLILVGDGQKYQEAIARANALGISASVQFTGFLPHDEVASLVNLADIAVAPYVKMDPSHFIGSPMKLFEYMAGAKAVIATDIGQIGEVIEHGRNGLRVEPGSASALRDAMLTLMGDDELRNKMGDEARLDAVKNYSWRGYALRLEALYHQVIEEKRGAGTTGNRVKHAI